MLPVFSLYSHSTLSRYLSATPLKHESSPSGQARQVAVRPLILLK